MSELEQRILEFLRQRGFSKAEDALKSELSSHPIEQYAASNQLEAQHTVLGQILAFNQQQTSPQWYKDSYRDLRVWVEASLDIYKNELMAIMFPVFVHCYLELVIKGFPHDAATFMEEFRADHQEQFTKEINALIALSYPEDLESNELAKRFREFKTGIQVSVVSFLKNEI
jgi:transcription initiation factor TFIID subunit 5